MMHFWSIDHWKILMVPSSPRPKWWQLYLALPLLVILFVADSRLRISARGHQAVQIGIVLLVYGLIHLWLKTNAFAFSRRDQAHDQVRIRVVRVPVFQLPDADEDTRLMFELPLAEDKGVLSDSFEMDFSDAEILPEEQTDSRVDGSALRSPGARAGSGVPSASRGT